MDFGSPLLSPAAPVVGELPDDWQPPVADETATRFLCSLGKTEQLQSYFSTFSDPLVFEIYYTFVIMIHDLKKSSISSSCKIYLDILLFSSSGCYYRYHLHYHNCRNLFSMLSVQSVC